MQGVSDRYERVVRVLGENIVENAVQTGYTGAESIRRKTANGANAQRKYSRKNWTWGARKSEMENQQRKKNKTKIEEWRDKTMKKHIYDESNGLSYTLHGDYYLPDLAMNEEEPTYGKYGMLRKQFLKMHRPARYQYLLMTGELTAHLNRVDQETREQVETLVKQMVGKQGVNENLKRQDQMRWVRLMNNIKVSAEEIVLKEIIYV